MSGCISPRHAQNPLSGERRKTLSITHHALSPPPSHHHLYIIHLINWLQRFYRITKSLKRPFVLKSDVKQWFTTTTTTTPYHTTLISSAHHSPKAPLVSKNGAKQQITTSLHLTLETFNGRCYKLMPLSIILNTGWRLQGYLICVTGASVRLSCHHPDPNSLWHFCLWNRIDI